MTLRDVTTESMHQFFLEIVGEDWRKQYGMDQAQIVADALAEAGDTKEVLQEVENLLFRDATVAVASLAAWAFQLGRQYELRSMARSMRGAQ